VSDAVARVLDLFRQSSKRGVTGVTHVTKPKVTPKSSMVTPVTPVTYLNQGQPTDYVSTPAGAHTDVHDFDERAAIAIYDGGIPEAYAAAFAQLQIAQPIGVTHPQWLRAIDDAGRFLDQWGHVAVQLQWSIEDLFRRPAPTVKTPALDLGMAGLCWIADGCNVTALDAHSVTIGNRRFFRHSLEQSIERTRMSDFPLEAK
jgi:hypothetical protein